MIFSPLYFSQFRVETGCFSCKAAPILQSTIITMQALPLFQLPYRHRTALPETVFPPHGNHWNYQYTQRIFLFILLDPIYDVFCHDAAFCLRPSPSITQRLVDNNDVWLSSPEKEISLFPLNYISLYHDLDQKF